MKAIITVGVSASGKSTWANKFIEEQNALRNSDNQETWVRIERDMVRREIQLAKGIQSGSSGVNWKKWNWKWEHLVTDRVWQDIFYASEMKFNIIISDTNLNIARRKELQSKLEKMGYSVETKEFPVTWEVACERDAQRENGVGYSVLANQFKQWNAEFVQQYCGTPSKPKAMVCDIDGTFAHMKGRSPYEWNRVGEDSVDENVLALLLLLAKDYKIVFLSGRDGCCYAETDKWIKKHFPMQYELFMRAEGDSRRDDIVKEELFWNHVADNYDVKFVFDDRPQMCRKWRAMNIKTFQVVDPYLEF